MRTEERVVTYICDRCGKKSDKATRLGFFKARRIFLAFVMFLSRPEQYGQVYREYDLCQNCQASLMNWLNDKGEK